MAFFIFLAQSVISTILYKCIPIVFSVLTTQYCTVLCCSSVYSIIKSNASP